MPFISPIAMKISNVFLTVRRVFKKHVGMTPREYVDKCGRGSLKMKEPRYNHPQFGFNLKVLTIKYTT